MKSSKAQSKPNQMVRAVAATALSATMIASNLPASALAAELQGSLNPDGKKADAKQNQGQSFVPAQTKEEAVNNYNQAKDESDATKKALDEKKSALDQATANTAVANDAVTKAASGQKSAEAKAKDAFEAADAKAQKELDGQLKAVSQAMDAATKADDDKKAADAKVEDAKKQVADAQAAYDKAVAEAGPDAAAKLDQAKQQLDAAKKDLDKANAEKAEAQSAADAAKAQLDAAKAKQKGAEDALNAAKKAQAAAKSDVQAKQAAYDSAKTAYDAAVNDQEDKEAIEDAKNALTAAEAKAAAAKTAVSEAEAAKRQADSAVEKAQAAKKDADGKLASAQQALGQAQGEVKQAEAAKQAAVDKMAQLNKDRQDAAKQLDRLEKDLKDKQSALDEALKLQGEAGQKVADAEKALADAQGKPGVSERLNQGAYAFFEDLGAAGKEALSILKKYERTSANSSYPNTLVPGKQTGPTSIENMKTGIKMMKYINEFRAKENADKQSPFKNLNPYKVNYAILALSMARASQLTEKYMHDNPILEEYNVSENIGYYSGDDYTHVLNMMYNEKAIFMKVYLEDKAAGKVNDKNFKTWLNSLWDRPYVDGKNRQTNYGAATGHYVNFVSPSYTALGAAYQQPSSKQARLAARSAIAGAYYEAMDFMNRYSKISDKSEISVDDYEKALNDWVNSQTGDPVAIKKAEEQLAAAKAAKAQADQKVADAEAAKDACQKKIDATKASMADCDQKIAAAQKEVDAANQKIKAAQAKVAGAQAQADQAQKAADAADADVKAAQKAAADKQKALDEANSAYQQAQAEVKAAQDKLDALQKGNLDQLKKAMDDAEKGLKAAQQDLADADKALTTANQQLQDADSRLAKAEKADQDARKQLDEKSAAATAIQAKVDEAQKAVDRLESQAQQVSAAKDVLDAARRDLAVAEDGQKDAAVTAEQKGQALKVAQKALEDLQRKAEAAKKIAASYKGADTETVTDADLAYLNDYIAALRGAQDAYKDAVTKLDEARKAQEAAKADYDQALSAYNKAEAILALAKADLDKFDFKVVKGDGQVVTIGDNACFTVKGIPAPIKFVLIDGKPLSTQSYRSADDFAEIIIAAAYLKTLDPQYKHTIEIIYDNGGSAQATFSLKAQETPKVAGKTTPSSKTTATQKKAAQGTPSTMDPSALAPAFMAGLSGAALLLKQRKRARHLR